MAILGPFALHPRSPKSLLFLDAAASAGTVPGVAAMSPLPPPPGNQNTNTEVLAMQLKLYIFGKQGSHFWYHL